MAKQKKGLYQDIEIDSRSEAQQIVDSYGEVAEKGKKGFKLSKIGTAFSLIGIVLSLATASSSGALSNFFGILMFIGIILGFASYIIGGGFGIALKTAGRLAEFGWFVVPVFPVDIVVFFFVLMFAVFAFFFIPVVFVGISSKQRQKDYEQAVLYLNSGNAI